MYQYLAKIKEIPETEEIKAYAKSYKIFHATCPFCDYTCEVHAVDEWGVKNIYTKCHICKKSFIKREK